MKKVLKTLILFGIILIVVGLSGRAINTANTASASLRSDELTAAEIDQIKGKQETSDRFKWIAFTGGILIIGSRLSLWIQTKRYPDEAGQ